MIYKQKPEIVDVRRLRLANQAEVRAWIRSELFSQGTELNDCGLRLEWSRGVMQVFWGDYIVKDITGRLRVYTPDEFEKLFERIGPAEKN